MDFDLSIYASNTGMKIMDKQMATLLGYVASEGSLRQAVKKVGCAYSKAWSDIHEAERALGFPLMIGATGSGSRLTAEGERYLKQYEEVIYLVEHHLKGLSDMSSRR